MRVPDTKMESYGFPVEHREPNNRAYTPHTSDEEFPGLSSLSLNDRSYRLYSLKKDGQSWIKSICQESKLSENEIRKRAKQPRKASHSVESQLDKMSEARRHTIEDLLERTNQSDVNGYRWDIVAIINDKPEYTKRTGQVAAFSVILARVSPTTTRRDSNPVSRERRRSIYRAPEDDYSAIPRRESRPYSRVNTSPTRDDRAARQSQSYRQSQSILEEDPFGNNPLFSQDGKPVGASVFDKFSGASLPPHIAKDEPIGATIQSEKSKKNKASKADKNDDIIDIDALLGESGILPTKSKKGGKLIDPFEADDHHDDFEFPGAFPSDPFAEPKEKQRGRKQQVEQPWLPSNQNPMGWGRSKSKSKSKTRGLSVEIPKGNYRPVGPEITTAGNRKNQTYWTSHNSATASSIPSDASVLEAEYEEYSSSASSHDFEDYKQQRSAHPMGGQSYMPATSTGRYERPTNYHRRGPPSPRQNRYNGTLDYEPEHGFGNMNMHPQRRPSFKERHTSDGAMQRYSYQPTSGMQRPAIITQPNVPRFTPSMPMSAHPGTMSAHPNVYNTFDSAMTPFPSDLQHGRREQVTAAHAELYIAKEQHRDREMELLQRERDLARREVEMHQEFARRTSNAGRSGSSRYNHEPRLNRRNTSAYNY